MKKLSFLMIMILSIIITFAATNLYAFSFIKVEDREYFESIVAKNAISLKTFTKSIFKDKRVLMVGEIHSRGGHIETVIEMVKILAYDYDFCAVGLEFPSDYQDRFDYVLNNSDEKAKTFFTKNFPPEEPNYPKLQILFDLVREINKNRLANRKIWIYALDTPKKWREDKNSSQFIRYGCRNSFCAAKVVEICENRKCKMIIYFGQRHIEKKSSPWYMIETKKIRFFSMREMFRACHARKNLFFCPSGF